MQKAQRSRSGSLRSTAVAMTSMRSSTRVGLRSSVRPTSEPEQHFIGWLDDVDPDALFAAGKAWGLQVVRRKNAEGLRAPALPLVEQPFHVLTLRVAERHMADDAPGFVRVVVRDRGFETLALRRRLAQLPTQPA